MNTQANSLATISRTVRAGVAARLYKGDLQNAVIKALGGRFLTIDEAAHAQRVLVSTGYNPPNGFLLTGEV